MVMIIKYFSQLQKETIIDQINRKKMNQKITKIGNINNGYKKNFAKNWTINLKI